MESREDRQSILSIEKQYELMYLDLVQTIADRKRTIFELSRWLVTVQGLIVGFCSINSLDMSRIFVLAPLLVGGVGFYLNGALHMELNQHRVTMARIRDAVGEDFAEFNREMIEYHLRGVRKGKNDYWGKIGLGHQAIVIMSTLISLYVVWMSSAGVATSTG